jgi:alpha-tubulin suppressor-like RCC1 family protein
MERLAPLAWMVLSACSGSPGDGSPPGTDASPPGTDGGIAGPAKATIAETSVDFGGVDCGSSTENKSVVVKNDGASPLTWSAALAQLDAFGIDGPSSGTIPPGQSATISISTKPVPTTAKAGDVEQTTLTITTSDPQKPTTTIPVKRTAQGAMFEVMPLVADFGDVPIQTQAPDVKLTVHNTGNKAASVSVIATGDFTATWEGSPNEAILAPDAELKGALLRFKPSTNKMQQSTAKLAVKGAVCGAVPDIALRGTGLNGVAGVSPGTLNYGLVDCGSQAVAQQVSVFNTGNAPFTFQATLGKGQSSPYALSATSGTVLPGNQIQILVTPKAIPQTSPTTNNLYGDTLTITTSAIGDQPHTVSLEQTAKGAILTLGANAIAFGAQKVGSSPTQQLSLKNEGNVSAPITITTSAPFSSASSLMLAGGASANLNVGYAPDPKNLGLPASGTLGISTNVNLCAPLPGAISVTGTSYDRASSIATGDGFACVIATSGNVYCWGDDSYGQLGDGTAGGTRLRPYPVQGLAGTITQLAAAGVSVCALKSTGSVSCWGANYFGQLGDNTLTDSASPVAVQNLVDATKLGAGRSWVCAVRQNGNVACWGSNYDGQLGNGTNTASSVPVAVANIADAIAIGGSYSTACAIRQSGGVSCWGAGVYGQLGNGTTTSATTPVGVTSLTNATLGAFGQGQHECVIQKGGGIACWGANSYGQLGNGTTTDASTFVTVSNVTDAVSLGLGYAHSCAVRQGGAVVCWGNNASGQLGNGTTTSSSLPIATSNLSSVQSISAGSSFTCAIRSNGTVACWGTNGYGQLGNGTSTSSLVPVDVIGLN